MTDSNKQQFLIESVTPLKIIIIYVILGGFWILFSDRLLAALVSNSVTLTEMQTFKGWFYIIATALMLYGLIKQSQTALTQSKEALRLSEERYRLLFENATDAILVLDEAGNYLEANRQAEILTGYSQLELQRMQPVDLVLADPSVIWSRFEEFKYVGRRIGESQIKCKDGRLIWVEYSATQITPERYQTILRDATRRKQAEEDLRASEERFRTIFEQAAVGMALVGLDGRWLRINQKFCDIVGYTQEELTGLTFQEITHPEDFEMSFKMAHQLLAGELKAYQLEKRYIHKDSFTVWINLAVSMVQELPGESYLIVIVEDITKRKQLEEQLRQSQKMEAIGRLAGGVAHDFNNLLTVIIGYSNLALAYLDEYNSLYKPVNEIQKAGERAAQLTRQLLAFSRRQVLQPEILDLNEVIADLSSMLKRLIGENIELMTIPANDLGRVMADPNQIALVIINLAVNARDAMPQGGKLIIESANVELDEEYAYHHLEAQSGGYVRLTISDTGLGMDEVTIAHIFEPFFTTKEVGKGTGLGLATVYGIVSQSGGFIKVYSEPDQGTTFKVYLPQIQNVAEALPLSVSPVSSSSGSETILLVEDEQSVRDLMGDTLKKAGYTVLEAKDGTEALRCCKQYTGPIHLLLTDVVMPGMSGRQLAEQLLLLYPQMRVLYISGYTDNTIVHHGVLDPSVAFLSKPFSPLALVGKIREVLDAAL